MVATDEILESYDLVEGLSNTDGVNLPSKQEVGSICEDLMQVIFPGYHDVEPISKGSLPLLTRHRVARILERLDEQICRSLRVDEPRCPKERSAAVANEFMAALPGLRVLLRTDVQAAYEGDPSAASIAEIVLSYPFVETIAIQRAAHFLYRAEVPLIPRIMTEWAHSRTGMDIHPGAQIGAYFFIDHGTGVVIGETCEIRTRVKVYQGVTLGALSFQKDADGNLVRGTKRHPTIEDGVVIYANATVLGGDTIVGANSVIGASVSLTKSVPPNTLVTIEKPSLKFREAS